MANYKLEIERYMKGETGFPDNSIFTDHGLETLNILADYLLRDMPIETVERYERLFKDVMKGIFNRPYTTEIVRDMMLIQKRLGFLLKYKSYAIKASHPLGYSIFIQEPGQGFSFQRHIAHKIEVFHILEVLKGGYVFICDYEDWQKSYDEKAFTGWLSGEPDRRYERFRIYPQPGDVFTIHKLNVVHTVIGCILEEYAAVSTDMVDRLYDQNEGRKIPAYFNREYVRERLKSIKFPDSSRHVDFSGNFSPPVVSEIKPLSIPGGTKLILSEGVIDANRYTFEPGKVGEPMVDSRCASCFYFTRGSGRLLFGNEEEIKRLTPLSLAVEPGDLLLIPHGMYYAFNCEGPIPLQLSEQKIPFEVAFISKFLSPYIKL